MYGETRGREKALAALGAYFDAGAAIFAAAFDLAVAGSDAASVELPALASAGVVNCCPQGSPVLPTHPSVLVFPAL